jgi:protein-S-isoprenylcysteine O-methyltransferase Ste14
MLLVLGSAGWPTLRTQRLKLVWLLAIPFLLLSTPSALTLLVGAVVSFPGLLLRGLAAGSIHKDQELATGGPYRHLRHPLYLGSFLLGLGLALAGGRWWFPFLFSCLYFFLYRRTIRAEEVGLESLFGEEYVAYRESVPAFVPRPRGHDPPTSSPGFRHRLYRRNKEWQAAAGAAVGFGLLWVRMHILG